MVTPGPLARHPRDLDLLLTALTTPAPIEGTPWRADLPTDNRGIDQLRVAIWAEDPSCPVDQATAQALTTLEEALTAAGVQVRHTPGPVRFADSTRLFEQLLHGTATATVDDETAAGELAAVRQLDDDDSSPRAIFLRHRTQTHRSWQRANEERARLRSDWQQFFTEHDVLVTPAAPTAAIPAGSRTLVVNGQERSFFDQTGWSNLTSHIGLPSLVAPVAATSQGLPMGVQIIGRSYADRVLLAVASQFRAVG
jgi:amidase